jgi:putative transposase
MNKTMPSNENLRIGRVSLNQQIYHVTSCTKNSTQPFSDFTAARCVVHSLQASDALGHTQTLAFVVMPDHVHWLFQLIGERSLSAVVRGVKTFSARNIGRPIWQKSFYDRGIRKEDDLKGVARYIIANPVRAGLVDSVAQYPHWDAIWL